MEIAISVTDVMMSNIFKVMNAKSSDKVPVIKNGTAIICIHKLMHEK